MLNPHESKTTLYPLAGTKTDMSPILTTNIILTKKTALFRSSHHFNERRVIHSAFTRRPNKIEANKPSLKVGLVRNKVEINFKE
jgi:hypothetical protein